MNFRVRQGSLRIQSDKSRRIGLTRRWYCCNRKSKVFRRRLVFWWIERQTRTVPREFCENYYNKCRTSATNVSKWIHRTPCFTSKAIEAGWIWRVEKDGTSVGDHDYKCSTSNNNRLFKHSINHFNAVNSNFILCKLQKTKILIFPLQTHFNHIARKK